MEYSISFMRSFFFHCVANCFVSSKALAWPYFWLPINKVSSFHKSNLNLTLTYSLYIINYAPYRRNVPFKNKPLSLSAHPNIGEVGAILIGFWYVFLYTDFPILDKLFELCQIMQTIIPHENHVYGFFRNSYPVPRNHQF